MKKRKTSQLEEAALEIVKEVKAKADQLSSSTSVKRTLDKIKIIQNMSEEELKGIIREIYGTDSMLHCDFCLLNKIYVAKGDVEKIDNRLVKKMKTMNPQSIDLEESVVRRIMCRVVLFHDRRTCQPEDRHVSELEITKFQYSCELQKDLYNLEKFIKCNMHPSCGCDNTGALISRLYEIGQCIGKLEFIEMLDNPSSENGEAATKGTIH